MQPTSLEGRNVLITGASTGIGRATAVALARRGATLYLAGRSEERHAGVLAECRTVGAGVHFLALELGALASVRACAQSFLALGVPLHVLIDNAGVAGGRGSTGDGFERAFGVNHLGHFLLTELLLECLRRSAPSRVVIVASTAHYDARGIDWSALQGLTRSLTGMPEYRVSKLCNVLYAQELSRRLAGSGVSSYALHPGVVASDIWRAVPPGVRHLLRLFMKSTTEGAATILHCATDEAAASESGLYYDGSRPRAPSVLASDTALALELTRRCREWAGLS